MAHWENLAGDLKLARNQFAWSAEPPLDLGGFVDGLLQFCMCSAHGIAFFPQ
jgi:hypothetical protein